MYVCVLDRKQMTGYSSHLMTCTILCTKTWQRHKCKHRVLWGWYLV